MGCLGGKSPWPSDIQPLPFSDEEIQVQGRGDLPDVTWEMMAELDQKSRHPTADPAPPPPPPVVTVHQREGSGLVKC